MNAIGPDVSFYADDDETPQMVDFVKMQEKADFVVIRVGQKDWPDSDFKHNWPAAKAAGLPRGSYWFYDDRADPKRQAELWFELLGGDLGELPLFLDIEKTYRGNYSGWRQWYNLLERLKVLVGDKEIGIYTAFYFWRDNAPAVGTASLEYFHQYPLWIANYGVTAPKVPLPWSPDEWLFWQFTETGNGPMYGTESKGVDLNWFNGDRDAFLKRFNLSDDPPPPPPSTDPFVNMEVSVRIGDQVRAFVLKGQQ